MNEKELALFAYGSTSLVVKALRLFRKGFLSSLRLLIFNSYHVEELLGKGLNELLGEKPSRATIDDVAERLAKEYETVEALARSSEPRGHYRELIYEGLCSAYKDATEKADEVGRAGLLLKSEKVQFILDSTRMGVISQSDLEARLTPQDKRTLRKGVPWEMDYAFEGEVSKQFVKAHESYLLNLERAWHEIHEELLSYGKQEFGKDAIAVYIDTVSYESIGGHAFMLRARGGTLWLSLGVKSIPNGGIPEFGMHSGEESPGLAPYIEAAYERLERAAKGDPMCGPEKYKSHTGNEEERDVQLATLLKTRFTDYISYRGHLLHKSMHGYLMFEHTLIIDVPTIVSKNPQSYATVVDEIIGFAKELFPNPRQGILDALDTQ